MIPYEDYIVYGPYKRKDGRYHVVLVHKINKTKKTVSYPKYRVECILGRYLVGEEEIHHIDFNINNNEDSNFQIVLKGLHQSTHGRFNSKYIAEFWKCVYCGKEWLATTKQIAHRISKQKQGKGLVGPFCSRRCQGKVCH